jgi:protein-S-isoprenylcysteine O-methyltransferase Ste14
MRWRPIQSVWRDVTGRANMATTPRDRDHQQETANLGAFRPPLLYGASIAIGLACHWRWPRPLLSGVAPGLLGSILVVASLLLFGASVQRFRAARTPVPARKPTTAIVRTGPYRFSRNPIYLAFSLLQLGIAVWVNTWWLVATLAAAIATVHYVVIPREERYLEARFGAEYRDYRASVRRWL